MFCRKAPVWGAGRGAGAIAGGFGIDLNPVPARQLRATMCRRHPIQWAACLLVLVSLCVPRAILAGSTDPVLAIGQIRARPAGAGSVVEVFGTWEFDNLVQVDFPLNVVVSQGANFVRLPAGGLAAESGSFAGLLDGLDPAELVDLENAGLPESGAELLRVEPHLIK
ncbi:MAG: hypothetical protein ACE5D3_05465, partial [Candidatus Binatia bacterium]